ncbi:hypothetical protein [Rhizobium nepotum]
MIRNLHLILDSKTEIGIAEPPADARYALPNRQWHFVRDVGLLVLGFH